MRLMAHQERAVDRLLREKRLGLWFDLGTGKTRTAIECARRTGESVLVLLPISLMASWEDEIRKWWPEAEPVRMWPASKFSKAIAGGKPSIALVPYSQFRLGWKRLPKYDFIVADESAVVKSNDSQITKSVLKYCEAHDPKYRLLMSGNPAPNRLWDYWSQYTILGEKRFPWSFYAFRAKFFEESKWIRVGGRLTAVDWKLREVERQEFESVLAGRGFRVRKQDCMDLPDQVFVKRTFKPDAKMKSAYETMMNDKVLPLLNGGASLALNAISEMMRLRQITSGFVRDTEGKDVLVSKQKFDLLDEALQEIDGQAIVMCQFHYEMKRIKATHEDDVGMVSGLATQDEREESIRRFQNGDLKYLCVHPESGGRGLNLQNCSNMIWFSQSYSLEQWDQSCARIHRKGQTQKCTYISLLAEDTIDEEIYKAVSRKQDYAQRFLEAIRKGGSSRLPSGQGDEGDGGAVLQGSRVGVPSKRSA